jgi:hypothetical protein
LSNALTETDVSSILTALIIAAGVTNATAWLIAHSYDAEAIYGINAMSRKPRHRC